MFNVHVGCTIATATHASIAEKNDLQHGSDRDDETSTEESKLDSIALRQGADSGLQFWDEGCWEAMGGNPLDLCESV